MVKKEKGEPVKLYCKGRIIGYKRSKVNQYENQSLIKIENVNQKDDTEFYLGKKCASALPSARPDGSPEPRVSPIAADAGCCWGCCRGAVAARRRA